MNTKLVFIVWDSRSRRAETLAAELGGQVVFEREVKLEGIWLTPLRYLVQGWKTWWLLERERPEIVIVQSPPTFAPLLVDIWCTLRRSMKSIKLPLPYVIDCHTGAFHRRKWHWTLPLLRWLSRRAIVTLVTDRTAMNILQRWKVKHLYLEDALPILYPNTSSIGSQGEERVGIISSLDDDEPITEIFTAARLLSEVTFYVTGNIRKIDPKLLALKPENLILVGYLRGGDYTSLLKNVNGLVVLTNEPHAVNCGAYEAVAMIKPALVSDWLDLRLCFTHGFIHVTNTPEAIAVGIRKMLNERERLTSEIIIMRSELLARRQPRFEELTSLLAQKEAPHQYNEQLVL
jgi:hypothetical protein